MFHTFIPFRIAVFFVSNDVCLSYFGSWGCFQRQACPIQKSEFYVSKTNLEAMKCEEGHLTIPNDGIDVWEIEPKHLKYGNKIASGAFGEL